ncbi:hypothetical protein LNP17_13370 [Klebsiella variicola subsp. variicola]|nr:hypothetical protein [Klebsiella variicola subsp. variicola]MCS6067522.1 hypothetical protein [Klebsiella variicola subsp. variicola]
MGSLTALTKRGYSSFEITLRVRMTIKEKDTTRRNENITMPDQENAIEGEQFAIKPKILTLNNNAIITVPAGNGDK